MLGAPTPAMVWTRPAFTTRTRLLLVSENTTSPPEAITARGVSSVAPVGVPPSPPKPSAPLPAIVATVPPLTVRIRSLSLSATYTVPLASTATPLGLASIAVPAGPSPL